MRAADARSVLKAETAAAHRALEDVVGPLTDRSDYIAYLRGLHAFRAPLEAALDAALFAPWRPTFIADALADDLAHLDVTPVTPEPAPDGLNDRAAALGALYVLEGSALGARVLLIQVQALGLDAQGGAKHLWRQSAALENWRAFLPLLESLEDRYFASLTDGANAVFSRLNAR